MEFEGHSFPEALNILADEAGVTLEPPQSNSGQQNSQSPYDGTAQTTVGMLPKAELLRIHEMAVKFYYNQTRNNQKAIDYFLSRGLTRETIREFKLGYSPAGWQELINFAKTQGIPEKALVQCGLAIEKSDTGRVYDRFRDRIMFPIFDTSKRPIGFGGRGMTPDAEPKYLNSPETPLYQKTKTLYGLHTAQYHIKQKNSVIIVEGYMDFLSLYQADIKNVIATSGTALTDVQARIIQRYTNNVFLVFDGDSAGVHAAQRGIFVLAPYNLDIRILVLPGNEDPDSFVKNNGRDAFLQLLGNAAPYATFIIEQAIQEKGLSTPQQKSAMLDYLIPLAQSISDSIVRQDFVRQIAERLGITEATVLGRFKRTVAQGRQGSYTAAAATPDISGTQEGLLLRLLISVPLLIPEARQYIPPETLTDPFPASLYAAILQSYDENPELTTLIGNAPNDEAQRMFSQFFAKGPFVENEPHEALRHTIVRLQVKYLKYQADLCTQRMQREPGNRLRLLEQIGEYRKQLKDLGE
jgi:DNA primase